MDTRDSEEVLMSMTNNNNNNIHTETYSDNSMVVVGLQQHRNKHFQSKPQPSTEYTLLDPMQHNGRMKPQQKSSAVGVVVGGGNMASSSSSSSSPRNSRHHEDLIFGELVGNMMTHIPSGETKDYLKLEIQQLIVKHKYPTADTHDVVESQCEEDSGDQE